MNTITIELCAEDRQRLDNILAALIATRPNCERCAGYVAEMFTSGSENLTAEQPEEEQKATDTPQEETAPEPEKQPCSIKREDVQSEVVRLTRAGHRDTVRGIVKSYAPCVSEIPEDKLGEVMARLKEVEVAA